MESGSAPGFVTVGDMPAEVSDYLTRLRTAQGRYLDSLADAGRRLPDGCGQITGLAALHGRLAQQFLDAQRSIMQFGADIDLAIVEIERASRAEAEALLAAAGWSTVTDGFGDGEPDLEAFAEELDAAGLLTPDRAGVELQLRELLDEWWTIERQEAKARIDDANARAAMRLHLAERRSAEQVERIDVWAAPRQPAVAVLAPPAPMPDEIVSALEAAGDDDLDRLLSSLLGTLEVATAWAPPTPEIDRVPAATAAVDAIAGVPAGAEPAGTPQPRHKPSMAADPTVGDIGEHDDGQAAFDRFWGSRTAGRTASMRQWLMTEVLLPAVAAVSVLALVLAWIG